MGWMQLAVAIASEMVATVLLDFSAGFTLPVQSAAALGLYALSFLLFTRALRTISLSIAYAIWSGLGTVAVVVAGITLRDEEVSLAKVLSITAIICGALLLNFASRQRTKPEPVREN